MRSEITYLFLVELLFSCPREKKNSAQKKEVISHLSFFIVFNRGLTVVKVSFCSLTKGITPKMCRLCIYVIINKRSFEPFMCLDLPFQDRLIVCSQLNMSP